MNPSKQSTTTASKKVLHEIYYCAITGLSFHTLQTQVLPPIEIVLNPTESNASVSYIWTHTTCIISYITHYDSWA